MTQRAALSKQSSTGLIPMKARRPSSMQASRGSLSLAATGNMVVAPRPETAASLTADPEIRAILGELDKLGAAAI